VRRRVGEPDVAALEEVDEPRGPKVRVVFQLRHKLHGKVVRRPILDEGEGGGRAEEGYQLDNSRLPSCQWQEDRARHRCKWQGGQEAAAFGGDTFAQLTMSSVEISAGSGTGPCVAKIGGNETARRRARSTAPALGWMAEDAADR
jgi:hypothetical protein